MQYVINDTLGSSRRQQAGHGSITLCSRVFLLDEIMVGYIFIFKKYKT